MKLFNFLFSNKNKGYNLPLWKVGRHKVYAKNAHDALKYTKKRGFWDRFSMPVLVK